MHNRGVVRYKGGADLEAECRVQSAECISD